MKNVWHATKLAGEPNCSSDHFCWRPYRTSDFPENIIPCSRTKRRRKDLSRAPVLPRLPTRSAPYTRQDTTRHAAKEGEDDKRRRDEGTSRVREEVATQRKLLQMVETHRHQLSHNTTTHAGGGGSSHASKQNLRPFNSHGKRHERCTESKQRKGKPFQPSLLCAAFPRPR